MNLWFFVLELQVTMAKVPVGKVLLRNVIRHTDAHNKAGHQVQTFIFFDLIVLLVFVILVLDNAVIDKGKTTETGPPSS